MIEIKADAISCIGSREVNEDAFLMKKDGRGRFLFAVADGLGGHGRGEVASQAAMQVAADCFDRWEETTSMHNFLSGVMWSAQNEIMRLHHERGETNGMKTTCVLLVICGNRAMWAHVGDTRLYWIIGEKHIQRTQDHSVPQMLVLQKEITEDQIRFHPDRNKLLRAMGNEWDKQKFDISEEYVITESTGFLLCTDGFWELIREQEMLSIQRAADSPKKWLDNMLRIVHLAGIGKDMDNHTAVTVYAKPNTSPNGLIVSRKGSKKRCPQISRPDPMVAAVAAAVLLLSIVLIVKGHKNERVDEIESVSVVTEITEESSSVISSEARDSSNQSDNTQAQYGQAIIVNKGAAETGATTISSTIAWASTRRIENEPITNDRTVASTTQAKPSIHTTHNSGKQGIILPAMSHGQVTTKLATTTTMLPQIPESPNGAQINHSDNRTTSSDSTTATASNPAVTTVKTDKENENTTGNVSDNRQVKSSAAEKGPKDEGDVKQ